MALSDLKKKSLPSNKANFNVEAFIDDANNYALGLPQIVSLRPLLAAEDTETAKLPMRHATFTLSEEAIAALAELSALTGESKSKLIRKLILRATQAVHIDLAQVAPQKSTD